MRKDHSIKSMMWTNGMVYLSQKELFHLLIKYLIEFPQISVQMIKRMVKMKYFSLIISLK